MFNALNKEAKAPPLETGKGGVGGGIRNGTQRTQGGDWIMFDFIHLVQRILCYTLFLGEIILFIDYVKKRDKN